jgi:hypothetical protein
LVQICVTYLHIFFELTQTQHGVFEINNLICLHRRPSL